MGSIFPSDQTSSYVMIGVLCHVAVPLYYDVTCHVIHMQLHATWWSVEVCSET